MSRGERPTVPALDPAALSRLPERAGAGRARTPPDEEPSSGVVLRPEMLGCAPRLALSTAQLMAMPLDHRAGFIASFVDGTFTVEMILDACAMPREEALTLLGELAARGVIVF